jgi:glycerol uptake facilitator-like aquaporin
LIGCSAGAALSLNPQNKPSVTTDIWAVNICWGFAAFVGITASLNISGLILYFV